MKKTPVNLFCVAALAMLLVTFAAAQGTFAKGGVQGLRGLHGHAVLPPVPIFTNCGTDCTSYNTGALYFISGTGLPVGAGQTIAMGFTVTKATNFARALTPNAVYTGNGGASSGKISAYLLKSSFTLLAPLQQIGTIPDFPAIRVMRYKKNGAPVRFAAHKTYFLCETEPAANVQIVWMASNNDLTSPFFFQNQDACIGTQLVWMKATGTAIGPAFEIK